jgi:hypothetical membrane protein
MRLERPFLFSFLIFSTAGIFGYQGSNQNFRYTDRFVFGQNFLSDLGGSEGYNHVHTALWINICFALALWSAALGGYLFFRHFDRKYSWLSLCFTSCLSLIPFLPADRFNWPHRIALFGTVLFLAPACVLAARTMPRRQNTIAFRCYSVLICIYLAYLLTGPLPDISPLARTIHVIAEMTVVYGFIGVAFFTSVPEKTT